MAEQRSICARREPAPSATGWGDTKSFLPEELLSEQVQRLTLFCLIAAAMWTVGFVMDLFLLPYATGMPRNFRSLTLEVMGTLVALVVGLYAATSDASSQRKADVGIVVMLANAAGIAALNTWAFPPPTTVPPAYLSWSTVLILVYSMVASHTPRRMLFAALVAASFDPIAFWIANLRGVPTPSVSEVLVMVWPNYTCAAIAMLPSRVLHRLGRKLRDAQALGSYHLVELLGRGGMGEVWRAEHELLARQAAIKLVRPEVLGARSEADAQTLLRRFEREAQATAALSSPHTIQPLRLRHHQRRVLLLRDGAAGRPRSRVAGAGVRARAGVAGGLSAAPGLPLAGRRPRARVRASRHQAGQHLRVPDGARLRLREGAGFRPREGEGPRAGHDDAGHDGPHHQRHAGVHGAGSDSRRRRGRSTRRRLRAGLRGVLSPDRPPGVRSRHPDEDVRAAPASHARAAVAAHASCPFPAKWTPS